MSDFDFPFGETAPGEEPFALSLDDFIASRSEFPPALVGDETEAIVPATGLDLLIAKGGRGKTTILVEASFYWASGIDWLGFPVPRPLRVLFLENEGPRELFRQKVESKRANWPHEIRGAIFVHTFEWGSLSLANDEQADRLRAFVAENAIDVVVGDPLDSLGIEGVGSPDDTRRFMELMGRVGLFRSVAFFLLHHPRKEGAADELDEAAGAWGGKPDTMLRLAKLDGNRARLSFPKIRWTRRGTRPALILAFDPETQSFTVVAEERAEADERDYLEEIRALLSDGKPRIVKEIAGKKDGGIGADEKIVRALLETHPDLFTAHTGDAAKALGRHSSAVVWKESYPQNSPNSPSALWGEDGSEESSAFASIDAEPPPLLPLVRGNAAAAANSPPAAAPPDHDAPIDFATKEDG